MSSPADDTAANVTEKPERRDTVFTFTLARQMLPLVRHIVGDVVQLRRDLNRIRPEHEHLFRQRRQLAWPDRSRRYDLQEQVKSAEDALSKALAELDNLSVSLVDPDVGQVGFPTRIDNRRAYFSWLPGEIDLQFWHFADDPTRRRVPANWVREN